MRVHVVYPFGAPQPGLEHHAPWSIGNAIHAALRARGHDVCQYDWEHAGVPNSLSDDEAIIGHPHPSGRGVFNMALERPIWRHSASIAPWNGSVEYTAQVGNVASSLNRVFCICGPRWKPPMPWNATRLDMAFAPGMFPTVKQGFNAKRRFLYVGCTLPCKGTDYLADVIKEMPGVHWGHIGPGQVPGCQEHGYVILSSQAGRDLLASYDFLVMPGRNDANPTTVLEAAHVGLIPVVTQFCGWEGLPEIPFGDARSAADRLIALSQYGDGVLKEMQTAFVKWSEGYTWQKFTAPILRWLEETSP